jgi:pSer/pThr/pTyr-binding forkhead associated (FHA) protein
MQRVRVTVRGQVQEERDVDRELTLGRKAPADIVVADTEVSSRHLKIRPDGDRVMVTDVGSTNGTTVDGGDKLAANTEIELKRGQKLKAGPAIVEVLEAIPEAKPESSVGGFATTEKTVAIGGGAMQSLLVNVARFKAAQARLVIAAEHDKRVVPIEEMEVVVGRDSKGVQITVAHQSVSSKHAKIRFENGRFYLEDLKSSNGTFLDGNPVAVATPINGDQAITFGTVDCLFVQKNPESGGAEGGQDPHAAVLCDHVVRLGKATQQQAKDVLAEHRRSGASLGQLFVERGVISPKEWSEIYRQRQIIGTLAPLAQKGGSSFSKTLGIVVVIAGLAALAFFFLRGK